jgi:hypothetical protein
MTEDNGAGLYWMPKNERREINAFFMCKILWLEVIYIYIATLDVHLANVI